MEYTISDIQYDLDNDDGDVIIETNELETQLKVIIPAWVKTLDEAESFVSDYISDQTGYCHCGFTITPPLSETYK